LPSAGDSNIFDEVMLSNNHRREKRDLSGKECLQTVCPAMPAKPHIP
jgi:hypothetical protein